MLIFKFSGFKKDQNDDVDFSKKKWHISRDLRTKTQKFRRSIRTIVIVESTSSEQFYFYYDYL